jgi:hypothetical protein
MDNFLVESAVEIPQPNIGRKPGTSKYPFATMKVGDSFAFDKSIRSRVDSAADKYKTLHPGAKFCIRSNGTTARIWRIA